MEYDYTPLGTFKSSSRSYCVGAFVEHRSVCSWMARESMLYAFFMFGVLISSCNDHSLHLSVSTQGEGCLWPPTCTGTLFQIVIIGQLYWGSNGIRETANEG